MSNINILHSLFVICDLRTVDKLRALDIWFGSQRVGRSMHFCSLLQARHGFSMGPGWLFAPLISPPIPYLGKSLSDQ